MASGRGILDFLQGTAFLVWYFRALGCIIGKDVCLYPNGADPMMTEVHEHTNCPPLSHIPSHTDLMLLGHTRARTCVLSHTQPDLVVLGDESCIDRASVVAHINTGGNFSLNPIVIGSKATLRSDSRLLSGATMLRGSTLLEHTLILGGDVVDEGSTWQVRCSALVDACAELMQVKGFGWANTM